MQDSKQIKVVQKTLQQGFDAEEDTPFSFDILTDDDTLNSELLSGV